MNIYKYILCMLLAWVYTSNALASNLVIEVTEGVAEPVPIAVVPFQWEGENILPEDVATIIDEDLKRSGQFATISRDAMLSFPTQVEEVFYRDWRLLDTDYLVIGNVKSVPEGYQLEYTLFDVRQEKSLKQAKFTGTRKNLRGLAHSISDSIYEQITGLPGAFSTKIAYVAAEKRVNPDYYRLIVSDSDGYNPTIVLESKEPIMSPNWSRDATKLAYVSFETGYPTIYLQNVATGERQAVQSFKGLNGAPAWSPDGSKIAMVLSKDGNPEIYILEINTSSLERVTNNYAIDTEPAWAADGKSILFTSDRGGKPQIYQVSLDTKWVERLTFDGDYNARASLTQDGRFLVVVSRHNGKFHIAVQDLKRGIMDTLTQSNLDESPTVAPNGSMVMYSTVSKGKSILAVVSVDGQIKYNLPAVSGEVRDPAWSPYLTN